MNDNSRKEILETITGNINEILDLSFYVNEKFSNIGKQYYGYMITGKAQELCFWIREMIESQARTKDK